MLWLRGSRKRKNVPFFMLKSVRLSTKSFILINCFQKYHFMLFLRGRLGVYYKYGGEDVIKMWSKRSFVVWISKRVLQKDSAWTLELTKLNVRSRKDMSWTGNNFKLVYQWCKRVSQRTCLSRMYQFERWSLNMTGTGNNFKLV